MVIGAAAWLRALALLAEFNMRVAVHNRGVRRREYKDYVPPLTATGAIAWDALADYMEVAKVAGFLRLSSFRAIFDGPLRRYLDHCAETVDRRGLTARTMEFARGTFNGYCRRRPWAARRAQRMVKEELERRFGASERWLIAVYGGRLNHHATRLPEEVEATA